MVGAWRCRRSDLIGDAFKKKAAEGGTLNFIMKRSPLSLFLSFSDLSATSPPAGNFPRLICRQVRATKLLREDTADCSPDPHLFFSGGEESIINLNSQTFKKKSHHHLTLIARVFPLFLEEFPAGIIIALTRRAFLSRLVKKINKARRINHVVLVLVSLYEMIGTISGPCL